MDKNIIRGKKKLTIQQLLLHASLSPNVPLPLPSCLSPSLPHAVPSSPPSLFFSLPHEPLPLLSLSLPPALPLSLPHGQSAATWDRKQRPAWRRPLLPVRLPSPADLGQGEVVAAAGGGEQAQEGDLGVWIHSLPRIKTTI